MKKTLLICLCTLSYMFAFSQERTWTLQEMREDYVETGREMRAETKKVDCDIEKYRQSRLQVMDMYDTATTNDEKSRVMFFIAKTSCPDVIDFYERVVQTDSSEKIRCEAIRYLGWIDAVSSIPLLLDRYEHVQISDYEKMRIGTFMAVVEDYDKAKTMLNQQCYLADTVLCWDCIWAYYMIGGQDAIDYYKHLLNNTNDDIIINVAAQRLAECGDVESAFPFFELVMKDEDAIKGGVIRVLKAIGNEQSLKLIKDYGKEK